MRGVKGSAPDNDMFNAQQSVLAKYPDIKVVATVYGQATASVAQSAIANVLPSLPHVDAVLGQGGSDDVGIAQAFVQYGGDYADKMPIIEGGGGTDFVKWWADENAKNGYQTVSMNTTPGIGGAAFWLGLSLLEGRQGAQADDHACRDGRRRATSRNTRSCRAARSSARATRSTGSSRTC